MFCRSFFGRCWLGLVLLCTGISLSGCGTSKLPTHATTRPGAVEAAAILPGLRAAPTPPANWKPDPLKKTDQSEHQVWISPTGQTAFGVIFFRMPFPVGHELALKYGFLREMQKNTGQAEVSEKSWDAKLNGIRFVAEGGLYKIRVNFLVRGMTGWAIYAGTLRGAPINFAELAEAEAAREATEIFP